MKEIKFKPFEKVKEETGWKFRKNRPIGQEWYCDDGYCTNGKGEGFRLHRGTTTESINELIDALNKRDVKIAELQLGEHDGK